MVYLRPPAAGRGRPALVAGPKEVAVFCLLVSCTGARPREAADVPRDEPRETVLEQARVAAREGDFEAARRRYGALVARDDHDDEARTGLARIDAWSGAYASSERIYREVLSRHPKDDDVRAGLFDVLFWQSRWDDAARVLDEAPDPKSAVVLAKRAKLANEQGDLGGARALADEAVSRSHGDPEIRALRDRFVRGSVRVTGRAQIFPSPSPNLGQVELSISQTFGHLILGFTTEHGTRPASVAGGSAYGATYGGSATWLFPHGFVAGAELGIGAPAASVPLVRARGFGGAPIGRWLSTTLGYTYRHYLDGLDTHGVSPGLGISLGDQARLDATYWLTVASAPGLEARMVHAFGISAGRTFMPWFSLRAGYAHGAETERAPAAFQITSLVSDAFFVGAELGPYPFLRVYPLYGLTVRGLPGQTPTMIHTLELGTALRW